MTKHFYTEKVFATLNMTSKTDLSKITYTKEDCQSIIDEGRSRTTAGIQAMTNVSECVKLQFEGPFLNFIMLKKVLEKTDRKADGTKVYLGVLPMAKKACNESEI
jgi:hypothetical protein